jgi:hypothetical protein
MSDGEGTGVFCALHCSKHFNYRKQSPLRKGKIEHVEYFYSLWIKILCDSAPPQPYFFTVDLNIPQNSSFINLCELKSLIFYNLSIGLNFRNRTCSTVSNNVHCTVRPESS